MICRKKLLGLWSDAVASALVFGLVGVDELMLLILDGDACQITFPPRVVTKGKTT